MNIKKIRLILIALIIIGIIAGVTGIALNPSSASGVVKRVTAPAQSEAVTPAQFVRPEPVEFKLPEGVNLAEGRQVAVSDFTDVYNGRRATDGRDTTYWEAKSFPSWLAVDLGEAYDISKAVLRLPPVSAWGERTQEVSVSVSSDEENWTQVTDFTGLTFNYDTGNAVLIEFDTVNARYLRVDINSNNGATGGQISELLVYE
jgi:hypothetical protein